MKTLSSAGFVLIILFLFSCKSDIVTPCEADFQQDSACKMLFEINKRYSGQVDFTYDSLGQKKIEVFKDRFNVVYLTRNYHRTKFVLDSICEFDRENKPYRIEHFAYDPIGRLLKITRFNFLNQLPPYEEELYFYSTLLDSILTLEDNTLSKKKSFTYFNESNLVYSISEFDSNRTLTNFTLRKYFDNGVIREDNYDGNYRPKGNSIKTYNSRNQLVSLNEFNDVNKLILTETFEYDQKYRIKSSTKEIIQENSTMHKQYYYSN